MHGQQAIGNPTDLTIAGCRDGTLLLPIPEPTGLQPATNTMTRAGSFTRGTGCAEETLMIGTMTTMTMGMATDTTGTRVSIKMRGGSSDCRP